MPSVPSSNSSSSLAMAEGRPETRAMPSPASATVPTSSGWRSRACSPTRTAAVRPGSPPDGSKAPSFPLPCFLGLCLSAVVCVVPADASAGELPSGLVEAGGHGAVDDVVTDGDPHATEDVGVDDDVEVHRPGVLRGERLLQPRSAPGRRGRGRPGRWRPAGCGARPRSSGSSRAPPRPCGGCRATACSASRTVAEVALPSSRSAQQPSLVGDVAGRVGERVAQLRARGDEPLEREQLVLELVGLALLLGAADDRDDPEVLEGVRAGPGSPPSAVPRPWPRGRPTPGRACSPKISRSRPALASGGTRQVGGDPAQAGLAAQHLGDREQVVADPGARPRRPRPPSRGPRSGRGGSRRRRPASVRPVPVGPVD